MASTGVRERKDRVGTAASALNGYFIPQTLYINSYMTHEQKEEENKVMMQERGSSSRSLTSSHNLRGLALTAHTLHHPLGKDDISRQHARPCNNNWPAK